MIKTVLFFRGGKRHNFVFFLFISSHLCPLKFNVIIVYNLPQSNKKKHVFKTKRNSDFVQKVS